MENKNISVDFFKKYVFWRVECVEREQVGIWILGYEW